MRRLGDLADRVSGGSMERVYQGGIRSCSICVPKITVVPLFSANPSMVAPPNTVGRWDVRAGPQTTHSEAPSSSFDFRGPLARVCQSGKVGPAAGPQASGKCLITFERQTSRSAPRRRLNSRGKSKRRPRPSPVGGDLRGTGP